MWNAGATPNNAAVAMAVALVKPIRRQFGVRSNTTRLPPVEMRSTRNWPETQASPIPKAAPMSDSTVLSISSCRTIPASPGTDRKTNSDFLPPRRRPRQHQARDVRARDEQHQPDESHQHEQRLPVDLAQVRPAGAAGRSEPTLAIAFRREAGQCGDDALGKLGPDGVETRRRLRAAPSAGRARAARNCPARAAAPRWGYARKGRNRHRDLGDSTRR